MSDINNNDLTSDDTDIFKGAKDYINNALDLPRQALCAIALKTGPLGVAITGAVGSIFKSESEIPTGNHSTGSEQVTDTAKRFKHYSVGDLISAVKRETNNTISQIRKTNSEN